MGLVEIYLRAPVSILEELLRHVYEYVYLIKGVIRNNINSCYAYILQAEVLFWLEF